MRTITKTSVIFFLIVVFTIWMVLIMGCEKKEVPRGYGFTIHKVTSFHDWMFGFEKGSEPRKNFKIISTEIFYAVDDTNNVAVLNECASIEGVKNFLTSDVIKEIFIKGGIVGEPDIYFLEELDKGSIIEQGSFDSKIFSVSIINVEDYDKWKADWDSSVEMRKENGQGAFQIFRNVDVPNQIVLFIEWESIEKANDFIQSDQLKEVLERSGVKEMVAGYLFKEVKKEILFNQ